MVKLNPNSSDLSANGELLMHYEVLLLLFMGSELCFRSANQSPVGKRETAPRAPSDETSQRLFWF